MTRTIEQNKAKFLKIKINVKGNKRFEAAKIFRFMWCAVLI